MPKFDSAKELSAPDALVLIRDILEYGHVIFTPHARQEMRNGNFTAADVIHILEYGEVEEKQFDQVRGNWKYRIKGVDIEGESGRVVTAIVSRDTQIIVTAF